MVELERQEPVATAAKVPGEDWNSLDFHRDLQDMQPGTKLYAAPVTQAQHSVPEGWKLVPVEPTEDVLEAIHNGGYVGDDQELRWFYQSILAAAPAPGGE